MKRPGQASFCVEPKVGRQLTRYNHDATLPANKKVLAPEESFLMEAHLVRCPYCRSCLNAEARLNFRTILLLTGYFLRRPGLKIQRREKFRKLITGHLTEKDYQEMTRGTWFKISHSERRALDRFLRQESS